MFLRKKNCFLLKNYHFGFLFKIVFFKGKKLEGLCFLGWFSFTVTKGNIFSLNIMFYLVNFSF